MRHFRHGLAAVIVACALAAVPSLAQADITQVRLSNFGPDGDTSQQAALPDVAFNTQTGEFLVVYEAGPKADNSHWNIYGQRTDGAGNRIGDAFPISAATTDEICESDPPSVAYSAQLNEFLVSWNQGASDCDSTIHVQRVGADGALLGTPSPQISTGVYTDVETTEIAYNSVQHEWMVGWKSNPPGDTTAQELFAQRLAPDLTEIGDDIQLTHFKDAGGNADDAMSLAYDPVDNRYLFVVHGNDAAVSTDTEAFGHLTDGNGAVIGDDHFRISHVGDTNPTNGYAAPPRVVYDPSANRFFVAWSGDAMLTGQVDNENEEYGRYVNPDGTLQGTNDIKFSDMGPDGSAAYNAARPDLVANVNAKELFASWHGEDNVNGLVDNEQEIFGQRLDVTGAEVGDNDMRISHDGPDGDVNYAANRPAVAINSNTCQVLDVWTSGRVGSLGNASEEWDIYGNLVDQPCPPVNQALPAISGTAAEGQTLTCANGTWSGRGLSFSQAWLRDGTAIAGATGATYVPTSADATHQIACRVTATDPDGSAAATSAAVTPTAKPVVVVTPPPPAKDTTPPVCRLSIKKQKLKNVLKKGLKVTASCNEAATLKALLKATFSTPKKKSAQAAKVLTVSTKTVELAKAGKVTFTLKLTKKAKKSLAKVRKAKLTAQITATDTAGNKAKPVKKSLTVKR